MEISSGIGDNGAFNGDGKIWKMFRFEVFPYGFSLATTTALILKCSHQFLGKEEEKGSWWTRTWKGLFRGWSMGQRLGVEEKSEKRVVLVLCGELRYKSTFKFLVR